jgi:hypothetical protein
MKCRIVSSRLPIKAHPNHTYKFLENMENHRLLIPGAANWTGDKDHARYRVNLGLSRLNMETSLTERVVGTRVCEEPTGGGPLKYRRYFKIQADEQTCVAEIAMDCEMSRWQRLFLVPLLRNQMEKMLRNLRTHMEKPKEKAASPPAPATPRTSSS